MLRLPCRSRRSAEEAGLGLRSFCEATEDFDLVRQGLLSLRVPTAPAGHAYLFDHHELASSRPRIAVGVRGHFKTPGPNNPARIFQHGPVRALISRNPAALKHLLQLCRTRVR